MTQQSKYSEEHILAALAHQRSTFNDFMDKILSEHSDDWRFHFYIDHLLIVIYEHYTKGKFITKSQACRLIPIGHTNTCKKYVEEAEKRNLFKFETDKNDARRQTVVPTPELITYVRDKLEAAIDEARDLVGHVAEAQPLPKDNLPLAEFPKKLRPTATHST